ncbi:hypothetical protein NLM16_01325 [Bradyrhizobium brasilense]|uniref:hypothetical protein n=1 Tax=Bradyrhizobium brasilense TaxID=1419277 RepID=UPI002877E503|nr:hypothetical protein [Bradyrhizobium brasilense]MCP3412736.1 hypothetical protein [Bradyrhizobium brasilense]
MRKSEACAIVARRLGLSLSRVEALVQRASEAGLLPVARGSDRPDLGSLELSRLFLAAVCDRGLGNAAATVLEFERLRTDNGIALCDVLEGIISGRVEMIGTVHQSIILQLNPAGATLVSSGHHLRFGAPHAEGAARQIVVPGNQLAAMSAEFRGLMPDAADEAVAVAKLRAVLN